MTRTASGRRRIGWLGWIGIVVAAAALALVAAWQWADAYDSPAPLDKMDAVLRMASPVRVVAAARYGAAPAQKLEVLVPAAGKPARGFPVVVFFHGGGWHSGDPHDYRFVARTLAERGYATALVGYRLNQAGRFPAMLEDSAAGVRWVYDHAAAQGIDPARMILMGHSAGAYQAVMLALDPKWLAREGLAADRLAGVIGLAGPYDFHPFTKTSSRNAMSHWPRPRETQPVEFARAGAPPLLLLSGTEDTVVRPRNTRALERAMAAVGTPTKAIVFDGMGHDSLIIKLARPFDYDARVRDAVFAVLAARDAESRIRTAASSPVQRGVQ